MDSGYVNAADAHGYVFCPPAYVWEAVVTDVNGRNSWLPIWDARVRPSVPPRVPVGEISERVFRS
jgi:hypothetical protein